MERLALVKCCTLVSPITVVIFAGRSKLPVDALKVAENPLDGKHGGGTTRREVLGSAMNKNS